MKVLNIKPNEKPMVMDIDGSLESLQKAVGGYIEAVYPFEDPVALITNEEGKLNGMPLNRALYNDNRVYDIVAGSFLIVGLGEDDFCSLTDEQVEKFEKRFHSPEMFAKVNGEIVAFPC